MEAHPTESDGCFLKGTCPRACLNENPFDRFSGTGAGLIFAKIRGFLKKCA